MSEEGSETNPPTSDLTVEVTNQQNSNPSAELFHQYHIAYLHHILRNSAVNGEWTRSRSLAEIERLNHVIEELLAANVSYDRQLQWERMGHMQALELEQNLRVEVTMILERQQRELSSCQVALYTTQKALELERDRLDEQSVELDRTQRKFHLVDSLVDTVLLEEDSQLEMCDRSRQITDVVIDLDERFSARYRDTLLQKDREIDDLRRKLESMRRPQCRRSQSEPVCF